MDDPVPIALEDTTFIWPALREEAEETLENEPLPGKLVKRLILDQPDFSSALTAVLVSRLRCDLLDSQTLEAVTELAFSGNPGIVESAGYDLLAFCQRDPACQRFSVPFLYYKGFHGLQLYRIGNYLWNNHQRDLALYLQSRVSQIFGMDIHPAARLGRGILIDHATSIVIGETAVVGDNVSMLHEVTLGGTGKATGDRHPKVQCGVLIGAGAKILGNVYIGKNAKIGAGSVVLDDVADFVTVAGVPAKPVGSTSRYTPALEMDHSLGKNPYNPG